VPARPIFRILSWCVSQPGPLTLVIALVLAAPVPLIMALAPDLSINFAHHDIFIPLDAAWRTLQGQWPHTDVYSPLGLAYFWQHGAAAWLWGLDGRVLIRANFIALPFVLVPAIILAWRRLHALFALLLIVMLTVLVTAPTFLDGPVRVMANLANYNRVGAAMSGIVCLWALSPPRRRNPVIDGAESLLVGLLLLILLYLKVTFFGLAGAITAVGCCTDRRLWGQAAIAGIVVLVGAGLLELLHPGLFLAYLGDIRRTGASNTHFFRDFYAPAAVVANFGLCLLIAALALATAWVEPRHRMSLIGILIVTVGCVLAATQNFGALSTPLFVIIMIVAQRLTAATSPAAPEVRPVLDAIGVVAVVMAISPFLITQIGGTLYELRMQRITAAALGVGKSDTLKDIVWFQNVMDLSFLPDHFTMQEAATWKAPLVPALLAASILDDGIDLLQRNGLDQRRIANLSFSNPFPFALRAPSPCGVALWWDEDRTYSVGKLTPAMVVGNADLVMVPKLWWNHFITLELLDAAQAKLQQDFTPYESQYWTAWARNPGIAAQGPAGAAYDKACGTG